MKLPRLGGSVLVGAGIAFSRLAGLLRETVIAAFLGSGPAVEAFTAAFRIPNMMQNLLGEGVLSASFIPTYSKLLAEGKEKEAGRLASTILLLLVLVVVVLDWFAMTFAGALTDLVASGYTGERRDLTITLVRITTPGIGLLVLSAWCLGVLNSHRKFFLSYVAPVIWNLVQVLAVSAFGWLVYTQAAGGLDHDSVELVTVLGYATVVGALAQLLVQLPATIRAEPNLVFKITWDEHAKGVVRRFLPVVGARGVIQISAWIDVWLASYLAVGAVATMRYASFLFLLPISLFGMSIAAAELPELATLRQDAIMTRFRAAYARIAYFVLPVATAYLVAGDYLTGLLFERGQFTATDSSHVWMVLGVMAFGLLFSTLSRLLQSALYSLNETALPSRASIARVVVSALVGGVAMLQFDQFGLVDHLPVLLGELPQFEALPDALREAPDAPRLGAVGIAVGLVTGSLVEFTVLSIGVRKRLGPVGLYHPLSAIVTGSMTAALCAMVLRMFNPGKANWEMALFCLFYAGLAYLIVTKQYGFGLMDAIRGRNLAKQT